MKLLKVIQSLFKSSSNKENETVLGIKSNKTSRKKQYYYDVKCQLVIEGKSVGFFPLTVSGYSKDHVAKKLREGVTIHTTSINRTKRKL